MPCTMTILAWTKNVGLSFEISRSNAARVSPNSCYLKSPQWKQARKGYLVRAFGQISLKNLGTSEHLLEHLPKALCPLKSKECTVAYTAKSAFLEILLGFLAQVRRSRSADFLRSFHELWRAWSPWISGAFDFGDDKTVLPPLFRHARKRFLPLWGNQNLQRGQ